MWGVHQALAAGPAQRRVDFWAPTLKYQVAAKLERRPAKVRLPGTGRRRGETEISAIGAASPDTPSASMKAGETPRRDDRRRGPGRTGARLRWGGAPSTRPRSSWPRVHSDIRVGNTAHRGSAGSCRRHATAQSDPQRLWAQAELRHHHVLPGLGPRRLKQ